MKYFQVEKEIIKGEMYRYPVCMDGTQAQPEYEVDTWGEEKDKSITTGFTFIEYDESGLSVDYKFYPVETNMETWEDNEQEVLNKIIEEHRPEDGWQNHDW